MTRGVKDSLVTLSALGAAGLLAYYSLSGPSALVESHPKSVVKRSFAGFDDTFDDNSDGYLNEFCLDGACDPMDDFDDVAMFADAEEDASPDDYELLRAGGKRKKKKGGAATSSNNDVDAAAAMAAWFKGDEGEEAIDAKVNTLSKQIERLHKAYPELAPAQLNPDAPDLGNGDTIMSDGTAGVMADINRDCSYSADNRVLDTAFFAIFPEDIMTAQNIDQGALHAGYVNFAAQLAANTASNDNTLTVGTYAANHAVKTTTYNDKFTEDLEWKSLNIPAKKNRQGSYNLAATQPNIGKILTNVWKKVQKDVRRSMDSQPDSATCQVFLFMHNLPYEYKTIAQGQFTIPNNIGMRCNIMPVLLYNSYTESAMMNIAARFNPESASYTVPEAHFRNWIGSEGNNFAADSSALADGLTSFACLSEQRAGCLVARSAWVASFEDEFRGVDDEEAAPTPSFMEGTTTTTGWTSTSPTETTIYESAMSDKPVADMSCCNVGGTNPTGLGGTAVNNNEQSCCASSDGSWEVC